MNTTTLWVATLQGGEMGMWTKRRQSHCSSLAHGMCYFDYCRTEISNAGLRLEGDRLSVFHGWIEQLLTSSDLQVIYPILFAITVLLL